MAKDCIFVAAIKNTTCVVEPIIAIHGDNNWTFRGKRLHEGRIQRRQKKPSRVSNIMTVVTISTIVQVVTTVAMVTISVAMVGMAIATRPS